MTAYKAIPIFVLALVMSLVLSPSPALAWWGKGHMVVAEIALRHLKPDVAALVEAAAADLSASGPFPANPDFVQLACWADDIKSLGLRVMAEWHYINIPYNPQNITIKNCPEHSGNVITVITGLVETLKKNAHRESPTKYVINFAIANLVHFYGDIHQPLHSTSLFSPAYPSGDGGGNAELIYINGSKMNLHALWDSICEGPQADPRRPLSSADYTAIKRYADHLEDTYKFTAEEKAETNAHVIAKESHGLAVEVVYPGISNGVTVNETYLARCRATAESRVTLAGYRLATQLNSLLADYRLPMKPNDPLLDTSVKKKDGQKWLEHVKTSLLICYNWLSGSEEDR